MFIVKLIRYVSGVIYSFIHCFVIKAGFPSWPTAELFNVDITVITSAALNSFITSAALISVVINPRCFFWYGRILFIQRKLYKKDKQGNKIQHNKTKNQITMYNYKLYTIARLVPNKSIQAVQLIY